MRKFRIRFEFKLADCWVGVFWRRSIDEWAEEPEGRTVELCAAARLDVWVCFFPCLPLHLVFRRAERRQEVEYLAEPEPLDDIITASGWKRWNPGDTPREGPLADVRRSS